MKFYIQETGDINKAPTEAIVIGTIGEYQTLLTALEEYVKNNKRKQKAKKLLKECTDKWSIF